MVEDAPPGYDPALEGCFGNGLDVLYWRNRCVGYSLQRGASREVTLDQATSVAAQAFAAWTSVICPGGGAPSIEAVDEGPVDCPVVGYDADGANQHVLVFRDDAWPYDDSSNTLALTTITFDVTDGEIFDADTELNSHDYTLVAEGAVPTGSYDLLTVMTHEAGHFLGLAHSQLTSALMYAHYHTGTALTPDDVSGICAIDPPDGVRPTSKGPVPAGACDPTPRNGFSTQCDAPADAGPPDAGAPRPDAGSSSSTGAHCAIGRLGAHEPNDWLAAVVIVVALVGRGRRVARCGAGVLLFAVGCADTNGPGPPEVHADQTTDRHKEGGVDAALDASASFDVVVPMDSRAGPYAFARLANWSPAAPGADFCLAPHGTGAFQGPLLANLQRALTDSGLALEGGVAGVPFPLASSYVAVAPGRYDGRTVAAGAADCSAGIGPDGTALPPFEDFTTIALLGEIHPEEGAPGLSLVAFPDDGLTPSPLDDEGPPPLSLRLIHAAPGQDPADLEYIETIDGGLTALGLFNSVVYGSASSTVTADSLVTADARGYVGIGSLVGAQLLANGDLNGVQSFLANAVGVNLSTGASVTIALVGDSVTPGAGAAPVEFVACIDNAAITRTVGSCSVLQAGP